MEEPHRCGTCRTEKSLKEFSRGKTKCKACCMEYYREYCRRNPEYAKRRTDDFKSRKAKMMEGIMSDPDKLANFRTREAARHRKRRFNLPEDQYQTMLEQQGGVCAICGKPESSKDQTGKVRSLALDHCHVTNKIRGLLCFRCNTKLHTLEDETFRVAAEAYLASHKQFAD